MDGREITLGVQGSLRFLDLIMWDRQTQSWWQQATGEAIVGELTGKRLTRVTAPVLSYEEFKRAYPNGKVLSREAAFAEATAKTGHGRQYGTNPYVGYDRAGLPADPALFGNRPIDRRLDPKARVLIASFSQRPVAYALAGLKEATAKHDVIDGRPIVLFFLPGVASALDRRVIAEGADVGQAALYDPTVDGRALTFRGAGDAFVDTETATRWLVSGIATSGPLAGKRLAALDHEVSYWFIWALFQPDTELRKP